MKMVLAVFLVILLVTAGGCPFNRTLVTEGVSVQAVDEGLVLKMSVPQRNYVRGQSVPVTLVVENATEQNMTIQSDSGALVRVSLWRQTVVGWQHVKTFPATAVMIPIKWILPAGKARTFAMNLPVTHDWPTAEHLRLTGHLNGRPCAAPAALIQAWATPADRDREDAL